MKLAILLVCITQVFLLKLKGDGVEAKTEAVEKTETSRTPSSRLYYVETTYYKPDPVYYTYSYVSVTPTLYYWTYPYVSRNYYYSANLGYTYYYSYRKDGNDVEPERHNDANKKDVSPAAAPEEKNKANATPEKVSVEDLKLTLKKLKQEIWDKEDYDTNEVRNKAYDQKWLLAQLKISRTLELEDFLKSNKDNKSLSMKQK